MYGRFKINEKWERISFNLDKSRKFKALTREELIKIRRRVVRRGVWFKAISHVERCIVNLTIKVVGTVRSLLLTGALIKIIRKLMEGLRSPFLKEAEEVGYEIADRNCMVLASWGYLKALKWMIDPEYVNFLGIIEMNMLRVFRTL